MDDWVVLAPTRWKLRAAIRAVNAVMANLLVTQHPDKTMIGRIARGFDFLGYRFSDERLALTRQTVERCRERVSRLYEQGADVCRIGTYLQRWWRWVRAGLGGRAVQMTVGGGDSGPMEVRSPPEHPALAVTSSPSNVIL